MNYHVRRSPPTNTAWWRQGSPWAGSLDKTAFTPLCKIGAFQALQAFGEAYRPPTLVEPEHEPAPPLRRSAMVAFAPQRHEQISVGALVLATEAPPNLSIDQLWSSKSLRVSSCCAGKVGPASRCSFVAATTLRCCRRPWRPTMASVDGVAKPESPV